MSEDLEAILQAARKLLPEQQRLLAERLLENTSDVDAIQKDAQTEALDAVEKTHGVIKGLDRETIIWLAEDEDLHGY